MKALRLSSFGLRGFVGESLTLKAVLDYASAFAAFVDGGRILIGRDTRISSPMLADAAVSALTAGGCEVLDFGICPACLLQFSAPAYHAAGALAISGGHHPMGWNAILLIGPDGAPVEPVAGEAVLDAFHAGAFLHQPWDRIGAVRTETGYAKAYGDALERVVNAKAIRDRKFRVLVDPVGGAGCPFLPDLARRFNLDLITVNAEPSGYLAREPEPRPRTARPLAEIIRPLGADAGFVFSSDMSRMSLVTERGEAVSEEFAPALAVRHLLSKKRGPVVVNCCSSRMIDDLASHYGVPLVKTPVGQAYVAAALADEGGRVGAEGSGSIALPEFSRAFDGFLLMAIVLEAMVSEDQPLSLLVESLRRYHIVKRSVAIESGSSIRAMEVMRERLNALAEGGPDMTDGLRVDLDDGWVHIRASRTEPLLRIISEARDAGVALSRAEDLVNAIEGEL